MNVVNLAHRGASGHAPENTVVAVQIAIGMRADLIEVDLQQTSDCHLVVLHDATLTRTTDAAARFPDRAPWRVRDFTLAEIRQLDAGSWFDAKKSGGSSGRTFAGAGVPTFSEVLDALGDTGPGLMVEVKSPRSYPGIGERMVSELRSRPQWRGDDRRLIVQSFDWTFVENVGALMPEAERGLIGATDPARLPELATSAHMINPEYGSFDDGFVRRVHESGMEIHSWTIDEPSAMREAIRMGVDGVITNRPDVLGALLRRRQLPVG